MDIKNTTVLTKKDFKSVNKKTSKGLLKATIFTSICFILILIAAIITKELIEIVCASVIGVCDLIIVASYILYSVKVNKSLKQLSDEVVYNYIFLNDLFNVEVKADNQSGNISMKYDSLVKYEDLKEYIYLYINDISFYIVKKSNFKEDYTELLNVLKEKVKK